MKNEQDKTKIKCPHCNESRVGWRQMANHMIHTHGQTAEAGAAMTSMKRFRELMEKNVVPEVKAA